MKNTEEYRKYKNYIRSKCFAKVREIVTERDKCCQGCGRTAEDIDGTKITFNVHHHTYRNLYEGGEIEAGDCVLLCSVCHRAIHGAKTNLRWFNKTFEERVEE